ncbi:SEC-C domain-containing protein [Paenibacillus sp. AGC30]
MLLSKTDISKLKLDPYEQCPCDSGAKFKFCCFKKGKLYPPKKMIDPSYTDERVNYIVKEHWNQTDFGVCLGFDSNQCQGDIKSAHSIQNNRILNRISIDSHLFSLGSSVSKEGVRATLEKISKKKASTFFGFCDFHDTNLFRPIEVKEYLEEPIQDFLFALKGHTIEYHKKIRLLNSIKRMFKEVPSQMLNPESVYQYRVAQLDVRDYEIDYNYFKMKYTNNEYDCLRTIYRSLDYEVGFAMSSSFTIERDINGKILNEIYALGNENMPSIFLNIYPTEGKTNIIISYQLKNEDLYGDYFNQILSLSTEELMNYLNYLVIQYTENVFFHPEFIESLSKKQQESLLRSFESSYYPLEAILLSDDQNYFEFDLFTKFDT